MRQQIFILAMMVSVSLVFADFSDDFSEPAQSNNLWLTSYDELKMTFTGGTCKLVNESDDYAGFAYHLFNENEKSSEFTLSGKISLNSENMAAGFICRLSTASPIAGYFVNINSTGTIGVQKYSASSEGDVVFTGQTTLRADGANELKVSMKEGKMNIACNGKFIGTFTDETNDLGAGDLALLVSPSSEAVFDDIVLTSVFEEMSFPTCFADSFENDDLTDWRGFGSEEASVRVDDGTMRISTDTTEYVYKVVDLTLNNFVMRATSTLRKTNTTSLYGLFLVGQPDPEDGLLPVANFGIIGNKTFNVMLSGQSAQPEVSTSIRGNPYIGEDDDTTFYVDTLEIIQREGADEYLFIVNTDTIERFSEVDFAVTGVGVFCQQQLDVSFDNFVVAEGTEFNCPVIQPLRYTRRTRERLIRIFSKPHYFDLSGRLLKNRDATYSGKIPSGAYIIRDGKRTLMRIEHR
jgi:hypothetical protein